MMEKTDYYKSGRRRHVEGAEYINHHFVNETDQLEQQSDTLHSLYTLLAFAHLRATANTVIAYREVPLLCQPGDHSGQQCALEAS